jgi:hypothetical protein
MEMREAWAATATAIDDLLVAHHGLRAALKPGHPPFSASLAEGIARYGEGPLFHLWCECRAVERLRIAWTGRPSPISESGSESGTESGTESAESSRSAESHAAVAAK